jgi:GNAT superfamily N-acetyltransferase
MQTFWVPSILTSDGYADVPGLAVAVSSQSVGIGRSLLSAAVSWSKARRCTRARLRSGVHRQETHGFARSKASDAFELLTIPSTSTPRPHHG